MEHLIPIGLAVLAGGVLQAATGFGFALVSAPIVFAVLEPGAAIWLVTILAGFVNVLTLATEGRRPAPLRRDSAWLLTWSIPGSLAGVALLRSLDDVLLQALVTVAVLASLAVRRVAPHRSRPRRWHRPAAGLTMGALNTSTGTGGPPLVLFLLARGVTPEAVRDTLGTVFLAGALLGAAALAATGTGPLPEAGLVGATLPIVAAGHLAGRRGFARLADGGYEAALTLVLLASAAGGLLRALG